MPDTVTKIKSIISENLGVAQGKVNNQTRFVEDLGADSLDIVELVMAFEEQYDIEIPDKVVRKLTTVNEAIEYIERLLQNKWQRQHKE